MTTLESLLDDGHVASCPLCAGAGRIYDGHVVGQMARKIRVRAGLSLRKAAELMGVDVVIVGEMERGKRPWPTDMVTRFDSVIAGESLRGNNTTQGET